MKKVLLLMMIVMGAISYGRDFEYREKVGVQIGHEEQLDRAGRYACEAWDRETDSYSVFHRELDTQYRGQEGR